MATLSKYKEHNQFTDEHAIVEIEYDFANDGGAVGLLDMLKVKVACVLLKAFFKVKTTFTSGGSATYQVGTSGDDDAIIAATAVASLVAGAAIVQASTADTLALAADEVIKQKIVVAAMTAGKGSLVMVLAKQ